MSGEQTDVTKLMLILEKAQNKALLDVLTKLSKSQINDDPQAFIDLHYPQHNGCLSPQISAIVEQKVAPFVDNKKLSDNATVALMVTFSPDPSHELGFFDLNKLAQKLCKPTKGVRSAVYCIEQRGMVEEEMGMGAHFHALLNLAAGQQMAQPARQITRICKMFAKYQTTSTHYLQVKKVSLEKLEDKINYIKGLKEDSEKESKLVYDRLWRQQYNAPAWVGLPTQQWEDDPEDVPDDD